MVKFLVMRCFIATFLLPCFYRALLAAPVDWSPPTDVDLYENPDEVQRVASNNPTDTDFYENPHEQQRAAINFPPDVLPQYAKHEDHANNYNNHPTHNPRWSQPDPYRDYFDNLGSGSQDHGLAVQSISPSTNFHPQNNMASDYYRAPVPSFAIPPLYSPLTNSVFYNTGQLAHLPTHQVKGYINNQIAPRPIPAHFFPAQPEQDIIRMTPQLQKIMDKHRNKVNDHPKVFRIAKADPLVAEASTIQSLVVPSPQLPEVQKIPQDSASSQHVKESSRKPIIPNHPYQYEIAAVDLPSSSREDQTVTPSDSISQLGRLEISNDKISEAAANQSLGNREGKIADTIGHQFSVKDGNNAVDNGDQQALGNRKAKIADIAAHQSLIKDEIKIVDNGGQQGLAEDKEKSASKAYHQNLDSSWRSDLLKAHDIGQKLTIGHGAANNGFSGTLSLLKHDHVGATNDVPVKELEGPNPILASSEAAAFVLDPILKATLETDLMQSGTLRLTGADDFNISTGHGLGPKTGRLDPTLDAPKGIEPTFTDPLAQRHHNGTAATDDFPGSSSRMLTSADHSDIPGVSEGAGEEPGSRISEFDAANRTRDEISSVRADASIDNMPELLRRNARSADDRSISPGTVTAPAASSEPTYLVSGDHTTEIDVIITGCQANSDCTVSRRLGFLTVTEPHTSYVTYCPLANTAQLCVDGSCDPVDSVEVLAHECGPEGCTLKDSGELVRGTANVEAGDSQVLESHCPYGINPVLDEGYAGVEGLDAVVDGSGGRAGALHGDFDRDGGHGKHRARRAANMGVIDASPTITSELAVANMDDHRSPGTSAKPTHTVVTTVTETATATHTLQAACGSKNTSEHEEDVSRAIAQNTSKIVEEVIRQLQTSMNGRQNGQA